MNIEVAKRWFTEREKVAIDDATGCWNWTGCVNEKGYGVVGLPGERRTTKAHRLAYDCERVRSLYEGWTFIDCQRQKHLHAQNGRGARPKLAPEVLIVNGPAY